MRKINLHTRLTRLEQQMATTQGADDWTEAERELLLWLTEHTDVSLGRWPVYPGRDACFKLWLPFQSVQETCQRALEDIAQYAGTHGLDPAAVGHDEVLKGIAVTPEPLYLQWQREMYQPEQVEAVHRRGTLRWYALPATLMQVPGYTRRWCAAWCCTRLYSPERHNPLPAEIVAHSRQVQAELEKERGPFSPPWTPPQWALDADV
jgi:hypothetical protein